MKWVLALCFLFQSAGVSASTFALGVGAYFYEPHEMIDPTGTSRSVIARPMLFGGFESPFFYHFRLEPHVGILFPQSDSDGIQNFSGFVNLDFGYPLGTHLIPFAGVGASLDSQVSRARNVDFNGAFVTPGGNSLSWVFTADFGLAWQVDSKFRLDAETMISRILAREARKFHFTVAVSYAI